VPPPAADVYYAQLDVLLLGLPAVAAVVGAVVVLGARGHRVAAHGADGGVGDLLVAVHGRLVVLHEAVELRAPLLLLAARDVRRPDVRLKVGLERRAHRLDQVAALDDVGVSACGGGGDVWRA
jgi:hypothetical protein